MVLKKFIVIFSAALCAGVVGAAPYLPGVAPAGAVYRIVEPPTPINDYQIVAVELSDQLPDRTVNLTVTTPMAFADMVKLALINTDIAASFAGEAGTSLASKVISGVKLSGQLQALMDTIAQSAGAQYTYRDGVIRFYVGKNYVLSFTDANDADYVADQVEQAGGQVVNRAAREVIFYADYVSYRRLVGKMNEFRSLKREPSRQLAQRLIVAPVEQPPAVMTPPVETPLIDEAAKLSQKQTTKAIADEKAAEARMEKIQKAEEAKLNAAEAKAIAEQKAAELRLAKIQKVEDAKAKAAEKAAEAKLEKSRKADEAKAIAEEKTAEAKITKTKITENAKAKTSDAEATTSKSSFTIPVVTVAGGKATIQWRGEVSELIKRLAREADANYGGIQGSPRPLSVEINISGKPVIAALKIIGVSMGDSADLVVMGNQYIIRYKETAQ